MKRIKYNPATKDHDMYLDSRYVGSRPTPQEARAELDKITHAALTKGGRP